MSSSSQLSILSTKRSLGSHFDTQFIKSKCKVRKVSSSRKFPPNCGRFAQNKLGIHLDRQFFSSKCKVRKVSADRIFPPNCGRFAQNKLEIHFDSQFFSSKSKCNVRKFGSNGCEVFDATRDETKKEVGSKCNEEVDPTLVGIGKEVCSMFKEEVDAARVEMEKVGSKSISEEVHATRVEAEKEKEVKQSMVAVENKSVDFMDLDSEDDAKIDLQVIDDFDGEVFETETYPSKVERDEAMPQYGEKNDLAIVETSLNPKCNMNSDLVNLKMVQRNHPEAIRARESLELFEEYYTEFMHEPEKRNGKGISQASNQAAIRVKEDGKRISPNMPFGHIPGVEIGDKFRFRAELAVVGLHCQMIVGIDHVKLDGKIFATSVVNSGRYENEAKSTDVLIYSGQGGNSQVCSGSNKNWDQKLERGNLALVNSMEMRYPIRVTFKRMRMKSETTSMRSSTYDYVYDGLYIIDKYWEERATNCKMVYKFELHRLPEQPRPREMFRSSTILTKFKEVCVLDDISNGLERVKIRVMNGMDDDKPLPFTYMSKMVYPKFFELINPIGCNCINGCSDARPCQCVKRNGVEIPFNENGSIIIKKPVVHECGPQCKCPPTCMNRVSQLGPQHHLEIFKTLSMGWGVRSRNYISMGSFICEYIGELLLDYDVGERIGRDEYLFDIYNDDISKDGFVIDALHNGNFGRFFNHSCSPNLFAQEVLYDHGDMRMPHIMFFAATNIPPLKELTYDYNYKIDHVRDKNGNIRKKDCHCGSQDCSGRMY